MSFIQPAAISAIAHSVDVPRLSDEAAKALAPDVEYRLREIIQEAQKFAKHAKRTAVTTEDIKQALRLRNADPVYGFFSSDTAKYLRVSGHPELFYVKDPDLTFNQLIDAPLPPPPRDMGLAMHWLAVGGVQPRIPENEPLPLEQQQQRGIKRKAAGGKETGRNVVARGADAAAGAAGRSAAAAAAAGGAAAAGAGGAGAAAGATPAALPAPPPAQLAPGAKALVEVQAPVRHLVPKELWVYFDKLVGLLTSHPTTAAVTSVTSAAGAAPSGGLGGAGGSRVQRAALPEVPSGATSGHPLGLQFPLTQPLLSLPSGAASTSRPLPAPPAAPLAAAIAAGGSDGAAARSHAAMVRAALASVSSDTGLHPLTPYFVNTIAEGVRKHVGDLEVLPRLLGLARALLANKDLHLAPYLKQLLPAVMTALLTSPLGSSPMAPSWAVRDLAASVLAQMCERFSAPYHNVQPQVCRVLLAAWQDPAKALDTKYGAVVGLAALGPAVVSNLLLPCLEPQLTKTLLPALATPAPSGRESGLAAPMEEDGPAAQAARQQRAQQQEAQQLRQTQAWQLFGALLEAVGGAMYSQVMGRVKDALPLDMLMRRKGRKAADWDDIERALAAQVAADKAATAVLEARQRPLEVRLVVVPPEHQHRFPGRQVVLRIVDQVKSSKAALLAAKHRAQEAAASLAATRRAWQQRQQLGRNGSSTGDAGAAAGNQGPTDMDVDGPPAAGANGHVPRAAKPAGSSSKPAAGAKAEAGGGAAAGGEAGDLGLPQLSAVLAESWKDDSDVGATLDALSHVFGERLLPYMPLFQLPSCNL